MNAVYQIFKYIVQPGSFELELPKRSTVLSVDSQHADSVLWALIDVDEKETETRKFRIVATGEKFSSETPMIFHGTFYSIKDNLVFHLFEETLTVV